jgi:hypothetical protein
MTEMIKSLEKVHLGMPRLKMEGEKPTSFFEFWPNQIIYIPVVLQWLWLALRYRSLTLPLISNPGILLAGMVGESKSAVLALAGKKAQSYVARYVKIFNDKNQLVEARLSETLEKMQKMNLEFPVIAKPDLGCRGAGVKIVANEKELKNYFSLFPSQASFLLQEKIPYEAEAGIFYIRQPNQKQGEIFSITLKYSPYVIGDGTRSLRELIEADSRASKISKLYFKRHKNILESIIPVNKAFRLVFAGSHCRGSIFRNGNKYITTKLRQAFDDISADIDGFYYGRVDVRFKNIDKLMLGKDFRIMEINGASSEATHIWDRNTTFNEIYKTLFYQYKILFHIGNINRQQGYKTPGLWSLLKAWREESKLVKQYPETD